MAGPPTKNLTDPNGFSRMLTPLPGCALPLLIPQRLTAQVLTRMQNRLTLHSRFGISMQPGAMTALLLGRLVCNTFPAVYKSRKRTGQIFPPPNPGIT